MRIQKLLAAAGGIILALSSCGKVDQTDISINTEMTLPPSPSMLPVTNVKPTTKPAVTPTKSITPTPILTEHPVLTEAPVLTEVPVLTEAPVLTEPPFLNPETMYQKISPIKELAVYFSEDKEKPQVVVCIGKEYYILDIEYHLEYGSPIVSIKDGGYARIQQDKILSIIVPLKEGSETVSLIDTYKICGKEYILDYQAVAEGEPVQQIEMFPGNEKELQAGYRINEEGERIFTLTDPGWFQENEHSGDGIFWYPKLALPEQDTYPIVYEEFSYFTDTGTGYRRVGIMAENEIIYLGKYCNNVFFPDTQIGYYNDLEIFGALGGPYLYDWQPRPIEPDTLLDLDGDGIDEKISYQVEGKNERHFVVTVNGVETSLSEYQAANLFQKYLYTASLDGKTNQLMVLNFGDGRSSILSVYSYIDGKLQEAGEFKNSGYWVREENGRQVCVLTENCHPLQHDIVEMKYELVHGILQQVHEEYYKFLEKWGEDGQTAERRKLIVKQEMELYFEKGGEKTFNLPAGSHVVTLGGDLADWILIENLDTKEQGWLNVEWDDIGGYFAYGCIRRDGTIIDYEEIFENLLEYD